MTTQPDGAHPIDAQVGQSGMVGWILPTLEIASRNLFALLPAVVLVVLTMFLSPHLRMATAASGEFVQLLDQLVISAIGTAIAAFGYVLLVRREGAAHGIDSTAPVNEMAVRLLLLLLFWNVVGYLLGRLLISVLTAEWMLRLYIPRLIWLTSQIGQINAVLFVVWVFSPLFAVLGCMGALGNVLCVRTRWSFTTILSESIGQVGSQLGRLILPSYVVFGILLVLLRVLIGLADLAGPGILQHWQLLLAMFVAVGTWLGLAWWFVLERAYMPYASVNGELGQLPRPPPLPPANSRTPLLSKANAPAMPALNAAQTLDLTRQDILAHLNAADPAAAVSTFARWLRHSQRSVADLHTLLQLFEHHWEALQTELAALTADMARNNRSFEAVELSRLGLQHNPAFMADQPDSVLAYAKRLVQLEHPDLSARLLATFVRQHRQHPDFLNAGLLLARLLMTHANQPETARKLLTHLKTSHPQEMQIDLLLRQLGTAD